MVSGGQTGVDRAALDVALELGMECGGWCPRGRRAEDGPLHDRYPLRETPEADYAQRTEWNVLDSDGTLILTVGPLEGGSLLTARLAEQHGRPLRVVDLEAEPSAAAVRAWLSEEGICTLNVAGPRGSRSPGLYGRAAAFLRELLAPR